MIEQARRRPARVRLPSSTLPNEDASFSNLCAFRRKERTSRLRRSAIGADLLENRRQHDRSGAGRPASRVMAIESSRFGKSQRTPAARLVLRPLKARCALHRHGARRIGSTTFTNCRICSSVTPAAVSASRNLARRVPVSTMSADCHRRADEDPIIAAIEPSHRRGDKSAGLV